MRAFFLLLMPALLVGSALYLGLQYPSLPSTYAWLLPLTPLLLLGGVLALAFRFNSVRIFFIGLTLLLVILAELLGLLSPRAMQALALLAPVALTLVTVLPERGIFTLRALPRYLVLGLASGGIGWWSELAPPAYQHWINWQWVPQRYVDWTPLSQPELVVFAVFTVLTLAYLIARPRSDSASLLAALVALAISLHAGLHAPLAAWVLGAAALTLLVSIVQDTYRMAFIDELTDLPARRALRDQLSRLGNNYTIAMLDVDHFKKFNDTYGHDVGDNVLRMIGSKMREVTGGGKPFRYGGEEFTIVFPGKHLEDARPHLEALRQNIADTDFIIRRQDRRQSKRRQGRKSRRSKTVQVTASIGMAERSDKAPKPWMALKAADKALYRAKRKGRNCVTK